MDYGRDMLEAWLSWWIWHGVRNSMGLGLNEDPMEGNDVNDQPIHSQASSRP